MGVDEDAIQTVQLNVFQDYLKSLCAALLTVKPFSTSLINELQSPKVEAYLHDFINDAGQSAIYVEMKPCDSVDEMSADDFSYEITPQIPNAEYPFLAIIKRSPSEIFESQSLRAQLQVMTFPGSRDEGAAASSSVVGEVAIYSALQQYTRYAFVPAIASRAGDTSTASDSKAEAGMVALQRRVKDLDIALASCQRRLEMPTINLVTHRAFDRAAAAVADGAPIDLDALGLSTRTQDDAFLNGLQTIVSGWVKEVQRVTRLTDAPFPDSVLEEVGFWQSLARALYAVRDQLQSPGVQITVTVLKQAKRFLATIALVTNTGLKDALDKVEDINTFLKGFPIEGMLRAGDMDSLAASLPPIFNHFLRIKTSKHYGLERAAKLLEGVSKALAEQMVMMITAKPPMRLSYEEFDELVSSAEAVFSAWHSGYARFADFFNDRCRKAIRGNAARLDGPEILRGLHWAHVPTQRRLREVAEFRERHRKSHEVLQRVLAEEDGGKEALAEVEQAYARLQDVDGLALGQEQAWEEAIAYYENRVDKAEEGAARLLGERLKTARNAEEMFRAVGRFSELLERPRIRAAAVHFQVELLGHVRKAVGTLAEKFTKRYDSSGAKMVAGLRDIPPLAGKILWARQIERQLKLLMLRIQDVLGAGWEQHAEGRQLKWTCDSLLSNLNTDAAFSQWLQTWRIELDMRAGPSRQSLLSVTPSDGLSVNFDPRTGALFKEVRHLRWLEVRIPPNAERIMTRIEDLARESEARYPVAISVGASLRSFMRLSRGLDSRRATLLVPYLKAVREEVGRTFGRKAIGWDSPELGKWVATLGEQVLALQQKEEDLTKHMNECTAALSKLRKCVYAHADFLASLGALQVAIDDMSLAGYSNLAKWAEELENQVEEILAQRVEEAISDWVSALLSTPTNPPSSLSPTRCHHTLTFRDGILRINPPLEQTRVTWISDLHRHLAASTALPRLHVARFEVFGTVNGMKGDKSAESTFSEAVMKRVPVDVLITAYAGIESQSAGALEYSNRWLQYQGLWELTPQAVCDQLGEDLISWQQLLSDAATARISIESGDRGASFGPLYIDCAQARADVGVRHESWAQDLRARFALLVGRDARAVHGVLLVDKGKLEGAVLSGGTKEVISGIANVRDVRRRFQKLKEQVSLIDGGEKLLIRQRFLLPFDWLQSSVIVGILGDVSQVLTRRERAVEQHLPALQTRINIEVSAAAKRSKLLVSGWAEVKPSAGGVSPKDALQIISKYQSQLALAKEEAHQLAVARDALNLDSNTGTEEIISSALKEASELKDVWDSLAGAWNKLAELKDTAWAAVVARKVRKGLEEIAHELRSLPNRVRQYEAHIHVSNAVQSHQAIHSLLVDLKSEALKDRHWREVLKVLNIRILLPELTLGHVWGSNLEAFKPKISEIVSLAQGEMALEEYLRQVRDTWKGFELDLVSYQNRVRLIRGWDILFNLLEEHLMGLSNMKQSPYFRGFAELQNDTKMWEEKLGKLQAALEVWSDVQRRWVYLEGIFFGSADIKAQLPAEYSRFKVVDGEFIALMRRVSQQPQVLEVVEMDGLQRQLERQLALLTKVQSALGEHLSRLRAAFSRFYFVGDDDLLEIVGGGSGEGAARHLGKMFACIGGLKLTDGTDSDGPVKGIAMLSKDGEKVDLKNPVVIGGVGAKEWLTSLEGEMKGTLSHMVPLAVKGEQEVTDDMKGTFEKWCTEFPTQIVVLACQIAWCNRVELELRNMNKNRAMNERLVEISARLKFMAESVVRGVTPNLRQKYEQLITEQVHQRDVTRELLDKGISDVRDFEWLSRLRFKLSSQAESNGDLKICMADASFDYGYEYLGIGERLVQTPLTDRCYLTLTQALYFRMGGNPFGPAGTGKTESVKALGAQLGRFVLVFNCDETFDYSAMGRLFAGICQVGAWGCFDEFNRLEERILSAVSQQILAIQRGLRQRAPQIEFLGRSVQLNPSLGIFITLNPGYAGRSNLPDNLQQLFRAVAMVAPDRRIIAQTMLYSQGIVTAEALATRVVLLFRLCKEQLSRQDHYDFGLRALKSVLTGAGALKRRALESGEQSDDVEQEVLIRSICGTVVPKLVSEDCILFSGLLRGVFPGCSVRQVEEPELRKHLAEVCAAESLVMGSAWTEKVLQLKQVLDLRHGVMLAGPAGSGKSCAWRTLLSALSATENTRAEPIIIDPKSMDKEALYGVLDPTTLEWTDGVFTKALRDISSNLKARRYWIIFDGDVDPEWAENLNSVLDDNRLLTLPSGERLALPPEVRILVEVDSLRHATPATVSRLGMVWFSGSSQEDKSTVTIDMLLSHRIAMLKKNVEVSEGVGSRSFGGEKGAKATAHLAMIALWEPYLVGADSMVKIALAHALSQPHIMPPSRERLVEALFSLLRRGTVIAAEYDEARPDFPMTPDHLEVFALKWLLYSLLWGFGGSMRHEAREKLAALLAVQAPLSALPPDGTSILALQACVTNGEWELWSASVPRTELETHYAASADVVVTTTDTVRHVEMLKACLASHRPLILCGPPGSGKTMTLTSALSAMPSLALVTLSFSSGAGPALLLRALHQHCEIIRTPRGLVMQPAAALGSGRWLVVFCDEINLPSPDAYGTPRVLTLLRQLTERGGFWRQADCSWISIRRIQFVGACNPPTDPGRTPLPPRFLRHAPVLLVDTPARDSLQQIYGAFSTALLRLHSPLKGLKEPLTEAMIELFVRNTKRFTADMHPQYVYSPRELSRWIRALYEAIMPLETLTAGELARLWAHEGLRLFSDRLVTEEERDWCEAAVDEVASIHFGSVVLDEGLEFGPGGALSKPLLYGWWLSQHYAPVSRQALSKFLTARLRVFYEEELDVQLVMFDEAVDHVLRIDRILRQPMGHVLLVGESGVGKTVLSKFVAWMNGLSIFQIKAARGYGLEQFDADLRTIMKRVGCSGERVCFIFDESNVLSPAFLERMNALLASGEIPGLFEGDELTALLAGCREADIRNGAGGAGSDSADELLRRFSKRVQKGLHVVFTMNPAGKDFGDRCATSPALFNRCVVDWFGTWSSRALAQVGAVFTSTIDLSEGSKGAYEPPSGSGALLAAAEGVVDGEEYTLRHAVVAALVAVHNAARGVADRRASSSSGARYFVSPRDYLDLIRAFVGVLGEKRGQLEEQQLHINIGLAKLAETQVEVENLQRGLKAKKESLHEQNELANVTLKQMVVGQGDAEKHKAEAEELSRILQMQNAEVEARAEGARVQLAEAEPALLAAQASVRLIRKSQLDEIRALSRPPLAVKTVLEAVTTMLGSDKPEWIDVRKAISKQDFIATVVHFDTNSLDARTIRAVEDIFSAAGDLDLASVTRASTACGPLYQWVLSQIKFSSISRKVEPLRQEVQALQATCNENARRKAECEHQISVSQEKIAVYKDEYAGAIRQIEAIKAEMDIVEARVSRAKSLLLSLESEKERWELSAKGFDMSISTIIGDCLISAAMITYAGALDHRARANLLVEWRIALETLGIAPREGLGVVEYLSKASDRLAWGTLGLPSDDLSIENAVILHRFYRYPLVVDPSGQATDFLMAKYRNNKISRASFKDPGFMKTLASAVRFGTALLVQDVESVDPILNPLLNREMQRTGGRTLVRIGSEDVDFSPGFLVILVTRDPCARFPPDLCSRVTLVNFTATPGSLCSQALGMILHAERPDVDECRKEVLQLQGEQSVRLRGLEERLLDTISSVQGTILEDDSIIKALGELKREAGEVAAEAERTQEVMAEVQAISNVYLPLAAICAKVYFSMVAMGEVHFLYQFSLQFFLDILSKVLEDMPKIDSAAPIQADRLNVLRGKLYSETSRRVTMGLLHGDKLVFALRLAQIALDADSSNLDLYMEALMKGPSAITGTLSTNVLNVPFLSESQLKEISALCILPGFTKLKTSLMNEKDAEIWRNFNSFPTPETQVPSFDLWADPPESCLYPVFELLLVKTLRPDRSSAAASKFIGKVLGDNFPWDEGLDLEAVTCKAGPVRGPILICSEPGHDASWRVDDLATQQKHPIVSVSMGAAEGFESADRAILAAMREGTWVLLRNVHLCPTWLGALEQRLHATARHPSTRIFLTAEVHPSLPPSLLRASELISIGAPTGVRAALLRYLNGIPKERASQVPSERQRIYALLAWLHAVILERLRYRPLGWARGHEFGEADAKCALAVADGWLQSVATGVVHIAPEDIPWPALRSLLRDSVYGGRVDNAFDQSLLDSFVNALFVPEAFDVDFVLCSEPNENGSLCPLVTLSNETTLSAFIQWAESLPHTNSPSWLGLASSAEMTLLISQGRQLFSRLLQVQDVQSETPLVSISGSTKEAGDGAVEVIERWLSELPDRISMGAYETEGKGDALHRCLHREVARGAALLHKVREDLANLVSVYRGTVPPTNDSRKLSMSISRSTVPNAWTGPDGLPPLSPQGLSDWFGDLKRRLGHLIDLASSTLGCTEKQYWLGGFFNPEAFVTATRQYVAQIQNCSLENLHLLFSVGDGSNFAADKFLISGLTLEGASWDTEMGGLSLNSGAHSVPLGMSQFVWTTEKSVSDGLFTVPLYLHGGRGEVMGEIELSHPVVIPSHIWRQRGVALIAWSPNV